MWNKIRNTRGFYMLLSVLCAIFFWLFVDVTQEPRTSRLIRNIPVQLVGTEALTRQSLMIANEEDPTLSITFTGVRTEVSRLNRSNIYVTADLSNCKEGTQELSYNVAYDPALSVGSIRVQNSSMSRIPVEIVKMKSKTISVEGVLEGSVADGYRYSPKDFSSTPGKITVTGPASLVQQVDHARATLTEDDLQESWSGELPLMLMDKDGKEVNSSGLELSPDTVTASFPVSGVRTVNLTVTLEEGGGVTKDDVSYSIAPQSIQVSGTQEALSALKGDSFSVGTVNLSEVLTTVKQVFPIELPDGVTNLSDTLTASVEVKLSSSLAIRKVTIPQKHIHIKNKPRNTNVEILTDELEVRIRGPLKDMGLLLDKDVYAEVDLSDVEEGTIGALTLPVRISVKGMSNLGSIDEAEVTMDLREEPEED